MIDLKRYGLANRWPKLAKLQAEIASLERRGGEVEGEVMAARNAIPAARDKDAEAAAKALRSGKGMPPAKHEAEALAALEGAERTLVALTKAVQDAQSDLARLMASHREKILAAVIDVLRDNGHELAHHAREASRRYAFHMDAHYDIKALAPPAPPNENAPAARNSFTVMGIHTTRSVGPARGHVEEMLAYLAGLEGQYAEPDTEEAGAA